MSTQPSGGCTLLLYDELIFLICFHAKEMQTNVKCCRLLNADLLHLVQKNILLYVHNLFSCDM